MSVTQVCKSKTSDKKLQCNHAVDSRAASSELDTDMALLKKKNR